MFIVQVPTYVYYIFIFKTFELALSTSNADSKVHTYARQISQEKHFFLQKNVHGNILFF